MARPFSLHTFWPDAPRACSKIERFYQQKPSQHLVEEEGSLAHTGIHTTVPTYSSSTKSKWVQIGPPSNSVMDIAQCCQSEPSNFDLCFTHFITTFQLRRACSRWLTLVFNILEFHPPNPPRGHQRLSQGKNCLPAHRNNVPFFDNLPNLNLTKRNRTGHF